MIAPPERSAARDAAIEAMLPFVAFEGWTWRALHDCGIARLDAELLFPGGPADMIEAFIDLGDRRMEAEAAASDLTALRLTERVRAVMALRLRQNRLHREAIRRAFAHLALPGYAAVSARCTARTVDAMWHAAGDRSADFSWYTKRAILASVYGATLLYWLRDSSEDDAETLAFLDRCLSGVGRLGRARKKLRPRGMRCAREAA